MIRNSAFWVVTLLSVTSPSWGFDEFYVGAGAGPQYAYFQKNSTITQLNSFNAIDKTQNGATGIFGSIFGGYAWSREQFFIAGELNADYNTTRFQSSNKELVHQTHSSTKYTLRPNYSVSILPGYLFTQDTLFYGRLGLARGRFDIDTSDVSLFNTNEYLTGFRYGLGIKRALDSHFIVRMEFSRIQYQRVKGTTFDATSFTTKTTSIHPITAEVEFGVEYHFI